MSGSLHPSEPAKRWREGKKVIFPHHGRNQGEKGIPWPPSRRPREKVKVDWCWVVLESGEGGVSGKTTHTRRERAQERPPGQKKEKKKACRCNRDHASSPHPHYNIRDKLGRRYHSREGGGERSKPRERDRLWEDTGRSGIWRRNLTNSCVSRYGHQHQGHRRSSERSRELDLCGR